jgi:hypothetical protein
VNPGATKEAIIATLVKAKFPGTQDAMVVIKAMEVTGLAFIPQNYDAIILALQK